MLAFSFILGLASHYHFNHREPHIFEAIAYGLVVSVGSFLLPLYLGNRSFLFSLFHSWLFSFITFATLFASIAAYRFSNMHPLARFPGPRYAKLSKWWLFQHVKAGRAPHVMLALHEEYGDVVRIGPNELSLRNLDAAQSILIKGNLRKGSWFEGVFTKRGQSVHGLRDLDEHAVRRAYWDKGFSGTALQAYSAYIKNRGEEFVECLRKRTNEDVNLSLWCSWLAFDIMGDIGFGEGFGMMEKAETHHYMAFVEKAMQAVAQFSEVPWIMPLLTSLPAGKDQEDMYAFSMESTKSRLSKGQTRHDLFSYFIQENGSLHSNMHLGELDADVRAVIIAGSDTTASVLTFIFEYLSRHGDIRKKLQSEVDLWRGRDIDIGKIGTTDMPVLTAVINETLRVRPVVPSKSQREVPAGGIQIAGYYIPEGTYISTPQRAVMRDERYFSPDPEMWRPERWLDKLNEQAMDQRAYFPFSSGPFNCAGRLLALMELRIFVIMTMMAFDIEPAADYDAQAFEDNILEYFTVQKMKPFMARLTPRTS